MTAFPDDCIQSFTSGEWWVKDEHKCFAFGALVWASVPFFDVIPYRLTATRTDPVEHRIATLRAEPMNASSSVKDEPPLPVAGLPTLQGAHGWIVSRMKRRPCLVLVDAVGTPIDKALVRGMSKSATHSYALLAPYYGVDQSARSGYNPAFVEKIKHATFPQWFWDKLPLSGTSESILRLDQIHPVGNHHQTFSHTGFTLAEEAGKMMREWLEWFLGFRASQNLADFKGFVAEFDEKPEPR